MSENTAPTPATDDSRIVTVTDRAARRILDVAAKSGQSGHFLRVSVAGGGCQGFSYNFSFDDHVHDNDQVFENADAKVVIDDVSLDLLAGSEIDFIEDLMGQYFKIQNPNASSSCGCGTSFSI